MAGRMGVRKDSEKEGVTSLWPPGSGENYAGACDSKREGLVDCRIECLRTEECGRHKILCN